MNDSFALFEHIRAWAKEAPQDIYLSDDIEKLTILDTYQNVCFLIDEFHTFGLNRNSRLLFRISRSVKTTLLYYALTALGVRSYLADPHEKALDFLKENQLEDTQAILTDENGSWELIFEEKRYSISFGRKDKTETEVNQDPDFVTMVMFTSGSTGRRKGVLLGERQLMITDYDTVPLGDYRKGDVSGIILPLNHVFGLCMVLCSLLTRHEAYFPTKMDMPTLVHELKDHHVTRLNGVPTLYLAIANELKKQKLELPDLRVGLLGGSPSSVELFHRLEEGLQMKLLIVYGMTECSSIACCDVKDDSSKRADNVGSLYPRIKMKLEPVEGYTFLAGEGEICIQGPGLFAGYLNQLNPFDEEGYFHTGDVGKFNADGFLQVTGRVKDIIIRNGVNIASKVIEDAFYSVPGVMEVSVVKKEDPLCGEAPFVFLVLTGAVPAEEIMKQVKSLLKKNEYPIGYQVMDSFPKTSSGKIDKIALFKLINK